MNHTKVPARGERVEHGSVVLCTLWGFLFTAQVTLEFRVFAEVEEKQRLRTKMYYNVMFGPFRCST